MPSNNRPSRNRKMPERFNSPSVQIETSTHSQTVATVPSTPPPSTPTHASSSSPSSAASTPTPLIRSGGIQWRKNLRATLPVATEVQHLSARHRQESEASVVEAQANSVPEPRREIGELPARKPEDEYDVDSPYFGLEHTPEWDDLGIDIDDQSQGRWYPPVSSNILTFYHSFHVANYCVLLGIDGTSCLQLSFPRCKNHAISRSH